MKTIKNNLQIIALIVMAIILTVAFTFMILNYGYSAW